jgi:hypothetical protein
VKNPSLTWNKDLQQFSDMKNNDLHQLQKHFFRKTRGGKTPPRKTHDTREIKVVKSLFLGGFNVHVRHSLVAA